MPLLLSQRASYYHTPVQLAPAENNLISLFLRLASIDCPLRPRQSRPLLALIAKRATELSAQEVANVLSSLARLGTRVGDCEGLASQLAVALRSVRSALSPQQLANAAWAIARLLEGARETTREALDFWALLAKEVSIGEGEISISS